MLAAWTSVPVLGVPVESRALSGLDSLLTIVQMRGGPSATCQETGNRRRGDCGGWRYGGPWARQFCRQPVVDPPVHGSPIRGDGVGAALRRDVDRGVSPQWSRYRMT